MKEFIQVQSPMSVNNVASALVTQEVCGNMKEFTVEKNPLNVNSVASVFADHNTSRRIIKASTPVKRLIGVYSVGNGLKQQQASRHIKELKPEKVHINVSCVAAVFLEQDPLEIMKESTLEKNLMNVNSVVSGLPLKKI